MSKLVIVTTFDKIGYNDKIGYGDKIGCHNKLANIAKWLL